MHTRSLAFSATLLLALVTTSVLLNREVIQGVHGPGDVSIATAIDRYDLGQTVELTGQLTFDLNEQAAVSRVRLNISGPQPIDVNLPVADTSGLFVPVTGGGGGTLPGGTTPGSTTPGSTLPSAGDLFV
ncbi:MAG: hypothetical protein O3A47_06430, partial [Chloroflexi bacterium]|nr:hypothetical protein [Chloroflexota bacterium]